MKRDHLFVSYATEDTVFARWLALRLTACGYRVWIDQFELLGGERFPAEIDEAIKESTFRVLAVLSRHSIVKPNPVKERTLALNIARERGEDFLIPLNLDGLRATELDWMTSDLTFIPFNREWAPGMSQLVEVLERSEAPVLQGGDGPAAARAALHPSELRIETPEILGSNLLQVKSWPTALHQIRFNRRVSKDALEKCSQEWAFQFLPEADGKREVAFSFVDPPEGCVGDAKAERQASGVPEGNDEFRGIPSWNLVKPLVQRALHVEGLAKGLRESSDGSYLYFPDGLTPNNKVSYRNYRDRRVNVGVVGERKFRGVETFRYHLAFRLDLLRLPGGNPYVKVGIRLHLTDPEGNEFEPVSANARRKVITRTWYNHQFYSRTLAVASFLSGEDGVIRSRSAPGLEIDGRPLAIGSDVSLDETKLEKGRNPFRSSSIAETEEI